jgi:hypothetical protein
VKIVKDWCQVIPPNGVANDEKERFLLKTLEKGRKMGGEVRTIGSSGDRVIGSSGDLVIGSSADLVIGSPGSPNYSLFTIHQLPN